MKFILVDDYKAVREIDAYEYFPTAVNVKDAVKWFKETYPDYFIEKQCSSVCLLLIDSKGSVLKVWDKYRGWYQ